MCPAEVERYRGAAGADGQMCRCADVQAIVQADIMQADIMKAADMHVYVHAGEDVKI